MKVHNSPSFGSKILYTAKLKRVNCFGIPLRFNVNISELEVGDMNVLKNTNQILLETEYGREPLCSFANECAKPLPEFGIKKKFLVVETPDVLTDDKYKAVVSIHNKNNYLLVNRLQSINQIPKYQTIKGAGSCIMYAIFKMAQKMHKEYVELTSAIIATDFYRKIGMNQKGFLFGLHQSQFDEVTEKIKDKYYIREVV